MVIAFGSRFDLILTELNEAALAIVLKESILKTIMPKTIWRMPLKLSLGCGRLIFCKKKESKVMAKFSHKVP
jgi:hypothetical protein